MRSASIPWRPLFSGGEAQPFLDAIEGIAGAIADPVASMFPLQQRFGGQGNTPHGYAFDLNGGRAGISLFFHYRSCSPGQDGGCRIPERMLNLAVDMMPSSTLAGGLYSGLPGVAWAVTHIENHLADASEGAESDDRNDDRNDDHDDDHDDDQDDDPMAEVDQALLESLRRKEWHGRFDLVSGLVGLGVYALERLPRPAGQDLLSLVLGHLSHLAVRADDGIAWLTAPGMLHESRRSQAPRGLFDLGVAHGTPGVMAFLGGARAAGHGGAQPLLDGATRWTLRQTPLPGTEALFPYWVAPDSRSLRPTRMGWCYGAPGIASALLVAARCAGDAEAEEAALDLALRAAAVAPEHTRIRDAGLCHGAAGVGHLFNRMYQATGHDDLRQAACFWLERALSMRDPNAGTGGFLACSAREGTGSPWVEDAGLISGAAGIGLAFLAAVTAVEPQWDSVMLASTPRSARPTPP